MTTTLTPDTARPFLQDFVSFTRDLSKKYGFHISLAETQKALELIEDYSDVEEVLYVSQAALCHTLDETKKYEALFCQRFLNYTINIPETNPYLPGAGSKNEPPKDPGVSLDSANDRYRKHREELSRLEEQCDNIREQLRNAENAHDAAIDARAAAAQERDKLTDRFYLASEKVMAQSKVGGEELWRVMDNLYSRNSPRMKALELILDTQNLDMLKDFIRDVTKDAIASRSGDKARYGGFATLLSMLKDLEKKIKNQRTKSRSAPEVADLKAKVTAAKERHRSANEALKKTEDEMQRLEQELNSVTEQYRRASNNVNEMQKLVKRAKAYEDYQMSLVHKEKTENHRDAFVGGHNAVWSESNVSSLLSSPVSSLSTKDINDISSHIRTNARYFKQTLRQVARTPEHRTIDIQRTIQASLRTDGDICRILYKKPHKSQSKIVLLADISGSCRTYSSLIMTYLGVMGDVFPGGCHQFAFVNCLTLLDSIFRKYPVSQAVNTVFQSVPSRGLYSDYGTPLRQLVTEYRGFLDSETTVIILGDGRGNNLDPAEEAVRWIREHCHDIQMFVTEPRQEWNTGDSDVGLYQGLGVTCQPVLTTADLFAAMENCAKKMRD